MSINQSSHFRYGAFTNSLLEFFDKVPVSETIMSSYTQEVFPSNSLGESSIEFEFETDRNFYLDMRDIVLVSSFNYSMEGSLMLSREKRRNIKQNPRKIQAPESYLTYVSNRLHSIFYNCEVFSTIQWLQPMVYILIRHKYRTNSTRQQ